MSGGRYVDIQAYTFGEALYALMKSKNITVENLCRRLNIKSKTTVARILNDKSGVKSIRNFYNSLMQANPLNLVEYEMEQLAEALIVSDIGKDRYIASKEIMRFLVKQDIASDYICTKAFCHGPEKPGTLSDLLESYSEYKSVRIYIIDSLQDGIIKALSDCLRHENITAEHYIPFEHNMAGSAKNFVAMLPVLNKNNYNAYQGYYTQYNELEKFNRFKNIMIALKTGMDGRRYTDIVSFKNRALKIGHTENDKTFTLLYNQNDDDLYDFYAELFDDMRPQHNKLKRDSRSGSLIENIISLSEELLNLERSWEQILIKPHFCFNSISPEVLLRLYNGEPLPDGVLDRIYGLHASRYANYQNRNKRHIGIYTLPGIENFLRTGLLVDHIPMFRPFTRDEAVTAVRTIIDITEKNPSNEIYLLKSDINYNHFQYLLFGSDILFFCDNYTDYGNMNFSYIINSGQAVNLFYDFIKNELIPYHCHAAAESLDILRELTK
jgi:transcriptional regulator with XRE-family HTH domain